MNNEPNKPIPAQELSEEELEGIVGGAWDLVTVTEKEVEVEVVKKGADNQIIQVTAMRYQ